VNLPPVVFASLTEGPAAVEHKARQCVAAFRKSRALESFAPLFAQAPPPPPCCCPYPCPYCTLTPSLPSNRLLSPPPRPPAAAAGGTAPAPAVAAKRPRHAPAPSADGPASAIRALTGPLRRQMLERLVQGEPLDAVVAAAGS
jgi:hypothetical protein